jgi:cytochrome c biogenesis protein CcmG/thiol:disulfide interchange protein DsbE
MQLSELRGQIVVVNFWASWCIPCHDEAPDLEAVWEAYRDRGVVMVGVAYTDTERNALAFIRDYGMTYPNGLDLETRISERYHITGVPETFVVNREGDVAECFIEKVTIASLGSVLDRLLVES